MDEVDGSGAKFAAPQPSQIIAPTSPAMFTGDDNNKEIRLTVPAPRGSDC